MIGPGAGQPPDLKKEAPSAIQAGVEGADEAGNGNQLSTSAASRKLSADITSLAERCYWGHHWVRGPNGPRRIGEPFTPEKLQLHINGEKVYGLCPIAPGTSTTRVAVLDLDSHKGETPWEEMHEAAEFITEEAERRGLRPWPWRSSGGQGIHLYFLWDEFQDAYSVRETLRAILANSTYAPGTGGVAKGQVEIFPKQDAVPADGSGNMFILPGAGKSELLADAKPRMSEPVCHYAKPERKKSPATPPAELAQLKSALDALPNTGDDEYGYDPWRDIIFAIHHATNGSAEGLALAHEFSSRSAKYDPAFLDDRIWPYIRRDRDDAITIGTIFKLARERGWHEDPIHDFEAVERPAVTKLAGRFTPIPAHEYANATSRSEWIIKDVLPAADLTMIYGETGSGKTFAALDMVGAVARGVDWRGHRVTRGRVGYVVAEGANGFRKRLKAYSHRHQLGKDDLTLDIVGGAPNLLVVSDVKELAAALGKADLVVIDTLAATTPGANENSAEDMGRALHHCKHIHDVTGAMVLLIHHSGKDAAKGARGWSGLRAACDAEIEITRFEENRVLKITKQKDGEDGREYGFKLETVQIGIEDDGAPMTSCVVEYDDAVVPQVSAGRKGGGRHQRDVLTALSGAVEEHGEPPSADALVELAAELEPFIEGPGVKDRRRENKLRAFTKLIKTGVLVTEGGYVRLAT